jgi:HSP20 family protein
MLVPERWTPFRELDRMERRMRRLFEARGLLPVDVPAADVYETDEEYVVELEVPGFAREELEVEVADHTLVVRGAHEEATGTAGREVLLHERLERSFVRRFELPLGTNVEQLTAGCEKGVLTMRVPKTTTAEPRKVEIAAG